jgi:hypothetical protein
MEYFQMDSMKIIELHTKCSRRYKSSLPKVAIEDECSICKLGFKPNPQATGATLLTDSTSC